MNKILDAILDFCFPRICLFCAKNDIGKDEYACPKCAKELDLCYTKLMLGGEKEKNVIAPFYYDSIVKRAVQGIKFNHEFGNFDKCAYYMVEALKKSGGYDYIDVVVPVPMHIIDEMKRGYNQSVELTEFVSKRTGIPRVIHNLVKAKRTDKQHDLNAAERRENLKGVFKVKDAEPFKDKTILLVDDVYTTGSTMNECKKELLKAGAKNVVYLAFSVTKLL